MTAYSSTVDTPIGPFTAVVGGDGAVLAAGWSDRLELLLPVVAPGLRPVEVILKPDLGAVTAAIRDYHAGDLAAIDEIPVRQTSGPFISHAWDVLRSIPPGKTTTYSDFAALAGRPEAIRAAAAACARNAVALFVPCHRIVGTDGTLRGFRWGLEAKRWLLDHEAVG